MRTKESIKQDVIHFFPILHPSHLGSGKEVNVLSRHFSYRYVQLEIGAGTDKKTNFSLNFSRIIIVAEMFIK